ncbi:target of Nesh-SH3 isoform X2 [Electrophorus electricus]|uniref:target of Nesh-SH3 isoform X2 n=1 Tax=Electrophorus electricus TaxID=8005 RepID=UPI0015D0B618|nr:target of Nesh-SH3 isoform X2 [Electrophorus electricus]
MLSEGGNMRTLFFLIISEVLLLDLICTSRVRVRRQTMKVRITATGDTIILKFLRPEADTKLEGYILGYGSGMFSKQFIKLPEENEHYETEIDAEPKYLIVVQPVKANKVKKKCTGKVSLEKPLHLMIGTVTPTSVHLSWGTLLKTPYTDAHLEDCEEDGEFTVRYKEKETSHKWNYETCPTTDTVIDNLKPDTPYEFEVRAETKADTGAWSPPVTHNTADIHEPLKPRSQLSPQKPTVDDPRAFPPVTIRHNITLSRHPPLVRHTADPPTPRGNQGTGTDGIASSSPTEDPLFLTQTLTFIQTLMSQPTSKTTSSFDPQISSISSTTVKQHNTIQFQLNTIETQSSTHNTQPITTKTQLITTETQPITTNTQPSTTETHTSTVKAQLHTTHPRTSQFHITGQPHSNTIQPQSRITQSQTNTTIPDLSTIQPKTSTEQFHCRTTKSNSRTTQKEPITSQAKPIITQPKHITTQPWHITILKEPIITQKQPIIAQPESITTKSLPSIIQQNPSTPQLKATNVKSIITQTKPRILQKISTTQSQTTEQLFSTALPTNIVQQQIPTQPSPVYEQVSLTQPQPGTTKKQPNKMHQPSSSRTTKHQTYTVMPKSINEHNTYYQLSTTTQHKQVSSTNASPTASTKDNFTSIPKADIQESIASQHPLSQHTFYAKETPSPITTSDWYTPSIHEIVTKTREQPLGSTKFQKESVLAQDDHLSSSTIQTPHTMHWQYGISDSTPENEPQIINVQHSGTKHVPEESPATIQTNFLKKTPAKFNVSHWPETQAVNKKLSGSQEGQVISRNSPSPHLLARPLGPKVVQNGTRLAKWVSHNSSSPELVTHPLDPTVVHTLSSALVVNGTHPAKWNASNSISPVLVADPLGPKVARNGTRPVKGNTSNSSTPVLVADPLGPKVARNGTRPVKGNTRNSSTPVLVADPLGPKVAWNGTRPVKGNTRNSSTPVLVADPLGPKVAWNGTRPVKGNTRNSSTSILVADLLGPKVARNGTRPVKGNTRNSSTPVLVADPLGPKVARNGTRPVKGNTRNSSTPVLVADPLGPKVVQNGTPSGRGPPGSTRNTKTKVPSGVKHQKRSQLKPTNRPRKQFESFANLRAPVSNKKTPNQAEQPTEKDKITDLKQMEKLPVLKPQPAPSTEKIVYRKPTPTSTPLSRFNGSWFGTGPNSTIFRAVPVSDVDAMGKQRFTAPHVIYNTGKRPEEPCSVTRSLGLFPDEENEEVNVTGPPKTPPSNVTVVTVEGCPSFVIIDWQKTDNETTAYEILTKGPNGNNIAVVTNQTHTAVENLKPQSNYEFTVTPKNELGVGPPTEPVSFSTESADPRISDVPTGKTAIWSSFPFKADSYSECNGRQFVKRTWYRKFVGIQLCNSLRYKIYLSDSLKGRFYTIGDQTGYGEDHCQFVDSYLDGRTGGPLQPNQLPAREGYFRSMRQEPVKFGKIGGTSYINYVAWYECGVPIPGSW